VYRHRGDWQEVGSATDDSSHQADGRAGPG